MTRGRVLAIALAAVAAAAVGGGLYLLGSPSAERARRLDDRRVEDLTVLARAVDVYWTRFDRLPPSVDALREEAGQNVPAADPVTGEAYEYRVVAPDEYEVCARFERESDAIERRGSLDFWSHRSGRQCFRREPAAVR